MSSPTKAAAIGDDHPNARVPTATVAEIRRAYDAGGVSFAELARRHGVSETAVSNYVRNRYRKRAPGPVRPRTATGCMRGEEHPRSKLSNAAVAEIRRAYDAGGVSFDDLCRRFGMKRRAIGDIIAGDTHKDAPGPVRPRKRRAKLSPETVAEIRRAYDAGEGSFSDLGWAAGVTESSACNAVRGRTHKGAPGKVHPALPTMRGEHHPRASLTNAAAAEIRHTFAAGGVTHSELARRYRVPRKTVARVIAFEIYRDAGGPPAAAGPGRGRRFPRADPAAFDTPWKRRWKRVIDRSELTRGGRDVLTELAKAGPGGLPGPMLRSVSGRPAWRKILNGLVEGDAFWRSKVRFPTATRGGTYALADAIY